MNSPLDSTSLEQNQLIIKNSEAELAAVQKAGGWKKLFREAKLQRKIKALQDQQFFRLDDYLIATSPEHRDLVQHLRSLLKNDHIVFSVYTRDMSFGGSHTTRVEGNIHDNGYSYSQAVRTNITWFDPFNVSDNAFPSSMEGVISHWGKIELDKASTGYAWYKTIPKRLEGFVTAEGNIAIKVTDRESEGFFSNGKQVMGKLIADHFPSEERNEEYQEQRTIWQNRVHDAWDELKKEV
ncbi:MAG TPA: hypothetical protein DCE41_05000 [Cytophagales bacterium]|nr:hypothetical protein [Cytophagales bacterium]HAA17823.1 hypothetical protein [Cytophagales bacterium]HAP58827.1 hypothetical protein [Cytophagales bacterium]